MARKGWGLGGVWHGALVCVGCSWRHQLANRHLLPFPWTLSLCSRWCPSASHRPVTVLSLLGLSFPLHVLFLSLGKLCQRSPQTFPVSLLCVGSTQRRATTFTVGQVHPNTGGGEPLPNGGCWHTTTFRVSIPVLGPPCGERIMYPLALTLCPWCVYCASIPSRGMGAIRCGGWWVVGGAA